MAQSPRVLHTMLRVRSLDRALEFYVGALGMHVLRREDYTQGRFTLAFVGYGPEAEHAAVELTHNWDPHDYQLGTGFGHVALGALDIDALCRRIEARGFAVPRPPGPMKHTGDDGATPPRIAFARDADGYSVELIELLSSRSTPADPRA